MVTKALLFCAALLLLPPVAAQARELSNDAGKYTAWVPDGWKVEVVGARVTVHDKSSGIALIISPLDDRDAEPADEDVVDFVDNELDNVKVTSDRRGRQGKLALRMLEGTAHEAQDEDDGKPNEYRASNFRLMAIALGEDSDTVVVMAYGEPAALSTKANQALIDRVMGSVRSLTANAAASTPGETFSTDAGGEGQTINVARGAAPMPGMTITTPLAGASADGKFLVPTGRYSIWLPSGWTVTQKNTHLAAHDAVEDIDVIAGPVVIGNGDIASHEIMHFIDDELDGVKISKDARSHKNRQDTRVIEGTGWDDGTAIHFYARAVAPPDKAYAFVVLAYGEADDVSDGAGHTVVDLILHSLKPMAETTGNATPALAAPSTTADSGSSAAPAAASAQGTANPPAPSPATPPSGHAAASVPLMPVPAKSQTVAAAQKSKDYDGAWNGQLASGEAGKPCARSIRILVANNTISGTLETVDGQQNLVGNIAEDGSFTGQAGTARLTGKFVDERFEGRLNPGTNDCPATAVTLNRNK
jgi:hypothetical protein